MRVLQKQLIVFLQNLSFTRLSTGTFSKPFTNHVSPTRAKSLQSYPSLCDPVNCRFLCPRDSPGENTSMGCHIPLQGSSWERGQTASLTSPALAGRFCTTGTTQGTCVSCSKKRVCTRHKAPAIYDPGWQTSRSEAPRPRDRAPSCRGPCSTLRPALAGRRQKRRGLQWAARSWERWKVPRENKLRLTGTVRALKLSINQGTSHC